MRFGSPNRSASLPKNSRNAPFVNEFAAVIHVICAVVMFKSLPMNEDVTVTDPATKTPIAIAIVAVRTNNTSCVVELKHAGRPLFVCTGSIGAVPASSSLPIADSCAGFTLDSIMVVVERFQIIAGFAIRRK